MKRIWLITFFVLLSQQFFAKNDSLQINLSFFTDFSSNSKLHPLWSYSNQWGIFTQYTQGEALAIAKVDYQFLKTKLFCLNAGLSLVGKSEFKESMLHEAYLRGKIFVFDFTAGMEANTPFSKNDDLSTGSFLMSSNARPIPKVGLGIFDYWTIPFTFDLLQIKGGLYHGWILNEDYDHENYVSDVLLHEKFAFGRINTPFVKPYFGLIHSVMMGGTCRDGSEIPIDYWASFFGRGSSKLGEAGFLGEESNAAGAHQGLWNVGLDLEIQGVSANLYLQRPFTDRGGLKFLSIGNKDLITGATFRFRNGKFIKGVNLEWVSTDYQMGEGNPDPVGYDKNGDLVYVVPGVLPEDPEGIRDWLEEHFSEETILSWEAENGKSASSSRGDAYDFFSDVWGHGYEYGGRIPYLENGLYYQGWSVNGLSTGTPLFHSAATMQTYADGTEIQNLMYFVNTRVNAINFAMEGEIFKDLDYRLKFTYTKNHGSLIEKYKGGAYSWILQDNYFYKTSKIECYTMLNLSYKLKENIKLNLLTAYDFGQLYHAFGFNAGITYLISR